MPGIDDRIEQIQRHHEDAQPLHLFEIMMAAFTVFFPMAGAFNAIRQYINSNALRERFESLFHETLNVVQSLEQDVDSLKEKVESPAFVQTLLFTAERTARTARHEKIKRFAAILGYGLVKNNTDQEWEDAAAYIRTLDEITEADIEVMKLLYSIQGELLRPNKSDYDPNEFTLTMGKVLVKVDQSGMTRDEFYCSSTIVQNYALSAQDFSCYTSL